jgi:hypothetical protein
MVGRVLAWSGRHQGRLRESKRQAVNRNLVRVTETKAQRGRVWAAEVRMAASCVRVSSDGRSAGPVEAGAVTGGSSQN